jgi:1-acyl-sn-glycerol-3-phosphate acyltransferase
VTKGGGGPPGLPRGLRLDGGRSLTLLVTLASLRGLFHLCAAGGVRTQGLELVPPKGPLLVCSNHVSNLDPLLLGARFPRVVHAMAKAEMFRRPLGRAYLERCNCFPVRRGRADRTAMRAALAVLRSGGALVLFPEGHRSPNQAMQPFEAGAGYLALRAGVPVVPCAIWGTEVALPIGALVPRRAVIHLRVGEPFLPTSARPGEVSREIRGRVAQLLPGAYRGSGNPDQVNGEDEG